MLAGAGSEVDDPVGRANRLFVMFDDDDGVAEIAKPGEGVQQLAVVTLMQTDRRLVEHVSTPVRFAPICVARRMRCPSPPDNVARCDPA